MLQLLAFLVPAAAGEIVSLHVLADHRSDHLSYYATWFALALTAYRLVAAAVFRLATPDIGLGGVLDRLFQAAAFQADDDHVFAHPATGKAIPKANVTRRLHKALADAGLDQSHVFHDLRHTFGTTMAASGVPMRTLQEWMGHKHVSTTERYADYAPRATEGEMISAAFGRPEAAASRSLRSSHQGDQDCRFRVARCLLVAWNAANACANRPQIAVPSSPRKAGASCDRG